IEATVKYLNLNLDLSGYRVPGNLPLELQIGSLHLLERNVQKLLRTHLQVENTAVKSRQLGPQSLPATSGGSFGPPRAQNRVVYTTFARFQANLPLACNCPPELHPEHQGVGSDGEKSAHNRRA